MVLVEWRGLEALTIRLARWGRRVLGLRVRFVSPRAGSGMVRLDRLDYHLVLWHSNLFVSGSLVRWLHGVYNIMVLPQFCLAHNLVAAMGMERAGH